MRLMAAYLVLASILGPYALATFWSARYGAAVGRADGFASLTWRDTLTTIERRSSGEPRRGDPRLLLEVLRMEATARPEPTLEHLRRQVQSFKGTTIAMALAGFFIAYAWEGLVGVQGIFGYHPVLVEPARLVFWTGVLVLTAVAWFVWVIRWPQGFIRTFVVSLGAAAIWLAALVVVGPSIPG